MADNAKNFAKVTVSTTYDAAATSIVLTAGHGANLPTAPFNVVWWNSTDYPDPSDDPNREIVRVTAITTDTLTVTRAQESTSASTKNTASKTYKMIAGLTGKQINEGLLGTKGADIASATTTDIGAATGEYLSVTGTTTITGLGTTTTGIRRTVTFTGALILTHNATSLILPTSANITTAAGDVAEFVSLGSGNWKCIVFQRASGASLVSGGASFIGSRQKQNASTSCGGSTWTNIVFQVENFDTDTMHDLSTNPERITIKTAGKYMIGGTAKLTNADKSGVRVVHSGGAIVAQEYFNFSGVSPFEQTFHVSAIFDCAVNDYLTLQAFIGNGGSTSGDELTTFWAHKIG